MSWTDIEIKDPNKKEVKEEEVKTPLAPKEEELVHVAQEEAPEKPEAPEVDEGDDEETPEKRRYTRSQRLKFQRDRAVQDAQTFKSQAEQFRQELEALKAERLEALKTGGEKYAKSVEALLEAEQRTWQDAFEVGDKERLAKSQQQIIKLTIEKDRLADLKPEIPEKPVAPQMERPEPAKPDPVALKWVDKNKSWFGRDKVMTAAAYAIDAELKDEGWDPTVEGDNYYAEIEARVKKEFPHKFQRRGPSAVAPGGRAPAPRSTELTDEERNLARRLGVSETEWKAQKTRIEQASGKSYVTIKE